MTLLTTQCEPQCSGCSPKIRQLVEFAVEEGWRVSCDREDRKVLYKEGMPDIDASPVKKTPLLAPQMNWTKDHCHVP
jgi:hypothetical protein